MPLSTQDRILIEQRVSNDGKSVVVAYLLWIFTGALGGHRFYLGRIGSAIIMLILFCLGALTSFIGVGFVLLAIVGVWALIDAFLIPGMVDKHKQSIRDRLTRDALA